MADKSIEVRAKELADELLSAGDQGEVTFDKFLDALVAFIPKARGWPIGWLWRRSNRKDR